MAGPTGHCVRRFYTAARVNRFTTVNVCITRLPLHLEPATLSDGRGEMIDALARICHG